MSEIERGYIILGAGERHAGAAAAARKEPGAVIGEDWYHVVPPPGEYESTIRLRGGKTKRGVLVIDEEAYSRILAAFAAAKARESWAGLIVDREHRSEIPDGDTEAAAWAVELERRADGLWARWEKTALGEQLLGGRNYRHRSPAFNLEEVAGTRDRYRPVELTSIGLTNTPHFRNLAPSLNRGGSEEVRVTLVEKLRARLKLPETADEDAVGEAVDTALAKAETDAAALATAQERITAMEKRDLEREADEFCSLHKARIKDAAAVRAQYVKDPAGAKALFGALAQGEAPRQPRMVGKDAGTPKAGADAVAVAERHQRRNTLVASIQRRDSCTRVQALARAERENPELFKPATPAAE